MAFRQLVWPRTWVQDFAGMCLRFAQAVVGAPVAHPSAWIAWLNQVGRHTRNMPTDVAVAVWFSHWGTYGSPPTYANWGHVVFWIPGRGYLSSPGGGYGQAWFPTIQAVEAYFNCVYVGWSTHMNGMPVIEWVAENIPAPIEEDPMPELVPLKTRKPRTIDNKGWSALASKDNGSWDVLVGGPKMRRCLVHCNIDADGPLDVRAVIATTKNNGQTVTAVSATYYERLNAPYDTYVMEVDLPAGAQHRLRMQARATTGKPVTVRQVGNKTLYWEEK